MKTRLPLALITCVLLIGAAYAHRSTPQPKPVFSSRYTTLINCASGMTKKEEREAKNTGTDMPSRCRGLGGYAIYISYSACASQFSLTRGEEDISLGMQPVNWKQKQVEWRLADSKPFAVIIRMYDYGDDLCNGDNKLRGESLMVHGLKGFEQIEGSVDARTANANLKARELADKGYAKPKA
ncbi:MAG TPA: hypothetical protein VNG71_16020 [Pyrinomonadaceae bacterium]|nr:hypothetical protein [Pyrinomonadaceae bacterium]